MGLRVCRGIGRGRGDAVGIWVAGVVIWSRRGVGRGAAGRPRRGGGGAGRDCGAGARVCVGPRGARRAGRRRWMDTGTGPVARRRGATAEGGGRRADCPFPSRGARVSILPTLCHFHPPPSPDPRWSAAPWRPGRPRPRSDPAPPRARARGRASAPAWTSAPVRVPSAGLPAPKP